MHISTNIIFSKVYLDQRQLPIITILILLLIRHQARFRMWLDIDLKINRVISNDVCHLKHI